LWAIAIPAPENIPEPTACDEASVSDFLAFTGPSRRRDRASAGGAAQVVAAGAPFKLC
jgi:hypothetical protein